MASARIMSLPTPPRTSHRDKENRPPLPASRVTWSENDQVHVLEGPSKAAQPLTTHNIYAKSILKKTSHLLLPLLPAEQREITPEPTTADSDPKYLESCVVKIISEDCTINDKIEACSILAARLRQCAPEDAQPQSSWSLFDPIRQNVDLFVNHICQMLELALVDPLTSIDKLEKAAVTLPSPKSSPRKKRGMPAEMIKKARDMTALCLSVIRLLGVILVSPEMIKLFTDDHLDDVLTSLLAIPLAQHLPSFNCRKTCALSIWLLQIQRLPADVLDRAGSRVTQALSRAIRGELGREGKKGAIADGLKAIYELSLYQPSVFVPNFTDILDIVLRCLLSPSPNIRVLGCHALSGFFIASTGMAFSATHIRIAGTVADFLKPATQATQTSSATPISESPIVRNLRTTLNVNDPTHIGNGPVWALVVLANLTGLLRSLVYLDDRINRIITSLATLSMRHKKSTIRALSCLAWRVNGWLHVISPTRTLKGGPEGAAYYSKMRDQWWLHCRSIVDMGAGSSLIAGRLGNGHLQKPDFSQMMWILKKLIGRNQHSFEEAMQVFKRLLNLDTRETQWDPNCLLPAPLFSSYPDGILSPECTDTNALQSAIRAAFKESAGISHIRPLTIEELNDEWVLPALTAVWKEAVSCLGMYTSSIKLVSDAWSSLIKAWNLAKEDTQNVAVDAVKILIELFEDTANDWTSKSAPVDSMSFTPNTKSDVANVSDEGLALLPNSALKLRTVEHMWSVLCAILPGQATGAAKMLVGCLMRHEEELVMDGGNDARTVWLDLVTTLLSMCSDEVLKTFWTMESFDDDSIWKWEWTPEVKSMVWKTFADYWIREQTTYESTLILLVVPFINGFAWNLTNEDQETWERLLRHGVNQACDIGIEDLYFLDMVAEALSQHFDPTATSSSSTADVLLGLLADAWPDASSVPGNLTGFVNEALRAIYPPESRNKMPSQWMLRTLTKAIEECPMKLIPEFLSHLQDGLSTWFADAYGSFKGEEFDDILHLYEMTLLRLRALPRTRATLDSFSELLQSIFAERDNKSLSAIDAFEEFWNSCYCGVLPADQWPVKIQEHFGYTVPVQDEMEVDSDLPASSSPVREDFSFIVPSTPITSRSLPPTPPRPPRPARTSLPLYYSPESPCCSRTQIQSGSKSSPGSPRRVRQTDKDKENQPLRPSKKLTMKSKAASSPLKRRIPVCFDIDSEYDCSKKVKTQGEQLHIPSLESELEVERLLHQEVKRSSTQLPNVCSSSRKRKRYFLDAIVVPTLSEISGTSRSPVALSDEIWSEKTSNYSPALSGCQISLRKPLSSVIDLPQPSSDDSFQLYASSSPAKRSSSDDDPHHGQVTPHHLISPRCRPLYCWDDKGDLLSDDDSDDDQSPSKAAVRRRLSRTSRTTPVLRPAVW